MITNKEKGDMGKILKRNRNTILKNHKLYIHIYNNYIKQTNTYPIIAIDINDKNICEYPDIYWIDNFGNIIECTEDKDDWMYWQISHKSILSDDEICEFNNSKDEWFKFRKEDK